MQSARRPSVWYKAEKRPELEIGAAEFWKHHNTNYNDDS